MEFLSVKLKEIADEVVRTRNNDGVPWPTWAAFLTYKHYWRTKGSCCLFLTISFLVVDSLTTTEAASLSDGVRLGGCCCYVVVAVAAVGERLARVETSGFRRSEEVAVVKPAGAVEAGASPIQGFL